MAKVDLIVSVKVCWWLRAYLYGVALMSDFTGLDPDPGKVGFWLKRGVRVKCKLKRTGK
ncbi:MULTISPECIES: hypothetical protein [Pseudomonas syringae group]|uniref:Uncharacterized protein n=3 Tax=Pseudomonas syringae group TaxID=136849 RepID=F3G889_PSESJ|nr:MULTISPECIES: hypothetical protein [Pseudomonas syringae group]EGH43289.1 hypothetical protein PSYPI_13206 [Pseudomonas syringae pv. pisi str. 1704B]SOQ10389.1 hypothetical protein CFBP1573P_03063 [Pseudomonas syringae pv. persicae]SOQ11858.1 hypothetical protein NCPPB2254_03569 [Pseudomonas syringae pv. persicae]SOS28055.1 putative membrane protein [Pseudomonas syringae pv. avii]